MVNAMGRVHSSDQAQRTAAEWGGLASIDDAAIIQRVVAAGVRASAVARRCVALGLGAVLLDASGRVLHVGELAPSQFAGALRIEADHLVGRDMTANAAIETLLSPVLGQGSGDRASQPIVITLEADRSLAVAAIAYDDDQPAQLLRAIVLLGADEATLRTGLAALAG